MKINKGLKNPPMPEKGTVKKSTTPAEVSRFKRMVDNCVIPEAGYSEIYRKVMPGEPEAAEYVKFAERLSDYPYMKKSKDMKNRAKMLVKKLKR